MQRQGFASFVSWVFEAGDVFAVNGPSFDVGGEERAGACCSHLHNLLLLLLFPSLCVLKRWRLKSHIKDHLWCACECPLRLAHIADFAFIEEFVQNSSAAYCASWISYKSTCFSSFWPIGVYSQAHCVLLQSCVNAKCWRVCLLLPLLHQNPGNVDLQRILSFPWDPLFLPTYNPTYCARCTFDFLGAAGVRVDRLWMLCSAGLIDEVRQGLLGEAGRKTRKTGKKWLRLKYILPCQLDHQGADI